MARPRGDIKVVCQNEKCRFYLKEEGKDIIKRGTYRTGHQRYFCKHCKTFFMETKGTPLYHKHLSISEIIDICKHLVEKNGIRSIERITGHHRDTIGQLGKRPKILTSLWDFHQILSASLEKIFDYLLRIWNYKNLL